MGQAEDSRDRLDRRLKAFGRRLRAWRVRRGLTQEQLGGVVGISHGHISEMESGLTNITVGTLWRLADALGVRAADLLDEGTAE